MWDLPGVFSLAVVEVDGVEDVAGELGNVNLGDGGEDEEEEGGED